MRGRLTAFATDVNKYSPLAIVVMATVVCLPSILLTLSGEVSPRSLLDRYALALILATIAVRLLVRLVVRYAARNVAESELEPAPVAVNPAPGRAVRQP